MNERVRDFMVPISKFPMISEAATFAGAVMALERAQEEYLSGKKEQRILLIQDDEGRIVGKLSPIDVVRGLEPDYDKLVDEQASSRVVNFDYVIQSSKERALLWAKPLDDLCSLAKDVLVKDFIRHPTKSQTIESDEMLNIAFHRFVMFRHDSLFVMEDGKLVGLLRFSDVYREIVRRIKEVCRL
ncbi:CBS domain containing protein [Alkalidesulfovibrio alkalitolerans DSM 16529]|jgi:CBS domain-containing protein|uniref:CBS domain containing protein n=1 Tax=Alkalidesulfovibrio alkalitolerans DSM 16529 TaxID=1121439 RepID=S7UH09_9BACT|nr:CBS domain-containing protein [Alkalidesulfovibrio alkalitolerans]EPR33119.1 CBS domain containing protein [Alkalidesulfovibrio alkalitolerans DSM 16529]